MSGIRGEMSELEELLGVMKDDRDDATERNSKRDKETKREQEKERLGAVIRVRATARASTTTEEVINVDDRISESGSDKKKTRKRRAVLMDMDDECESCVSALENANKERMKMEEKKLELAKRQFE